MIRPPDLRAVARAGLMALLPLLTACYSYVPASVEDVAPQAAVRARITSEAAADLSEILGERRLVLDGELVATTQEAIFVVVPAAVVPGMRLEVLHQEVQIPRAGLLEFQRRVVDRVRSGAVAAAVVTVAGVVLYRTLSGDRGGEGTPPGSGGATELSVPVSRFPQP